MDKNKLKEWVNHQLGAQIENNLYPFKVRFGYIQTAPRHKRFDGVRNIGKEHIDNILNAESISETELVFFFPERHMSENEIGAFMYNLSKNPDADKIKSVDIFSTSSSIKSDFMKEQITIVTWEDDYKHDGELTL